MHNVSTSQYWITTFSFSGWMYQRIVPPLKEITYAVYLGAFKTEYTFKRQVRVFLLKHALRYVEEYVYSLSIESGAQFCSPLFKMTCPIWSCVLLKPRLNWNLCKCRPNDLTDMSHINSLNEGDNKSLEINVKLFIMSSKVSLCVSCFGILYFENHIYFL